MSSLQELKVTERDTTLTPRQLRQAGFVPATIAGKGTASQAVQVRAHEFNQLYVQGVREFQLTGYANAKVKAQQVQSDPVSRKALSIQFIQLDGQTAEKPSKPKKEPKAEKPAEQAPAAEEAPEAETVLSGA